MPSCSRTPELRSARPGFGHVHRGFSSECRSRVPDAIFDVRAQMAERSGKGCPHAGEVVDEEVRAVHARVPRGDRKSMEWCRKYAADRVLEWESATVTKGEKKPIFLTQPTRPAAKFDSPSPPRL